MSEIKNRAANSSLKELDLEALAPKTARLFFDLAPWLFEGMILREKDFRQHLKAHDWAQYAEKPVAVGCTADAIVPTWAFMAVAGHLQEHATHVHFGSLESLDDLLFREALETVDWESFRDERVVVRGCSEVPVPTSAYAEATRRLAPIARLIMYGEPCSHVPVYKKPKVKKSV